jgi:xanthine dehydrogenase large subunit
VKHIDAASHTRGESQYISDLPQPAEMLYAAIFSSPVAHGNIKKFDISGAIAFEGVAAVITAKDIPGENQIGPLIQDEPLLAEEKVSYIGQPAVIVVATTPEIARKAVKLIHIEIEELPPITDPRDAFARGEIIGTVRTFALGDVDSAWKECEAVVEGRCDIGGQEHVYLETQAARAELLEGGMIKLYASTQSPYAVQKHAAKVLGAANHNIEVEVKRLGGGFGGKEDQATSWACMAALAAWKVQKPVELVLSRQEDLKMTGKRHPYSSDFKIGLNKDGKILAYEVKHYQNAGSAADLSPAILERTLFHSTNAYFIPNVRIFAASCRTNLPPNTAFRGFGGPQGMFVIESAIAKAAGALSIPREEIQKKNLLQDGDFFPYGQKAKNAHARRTWQFAEEKYDLNDIRKRVDIYNREHFETKKGFAVMPICFGISFTATFMNQGSSLVHVYTDGSVSITTGGVEMGQGINTKIVNIAARAFGISEEGVKIESTNTTRIANMSPTAASASTDLYGKATLSAVGQILERLKSVAAKELKVANEDKLTISGEKILYDGRETGWNWAKLVQAAYFSRVALSAHAFYATPEIFFDKTKEKGHPFAYHVFGTAIIEVSVDCIRGTYDIDSIKIVHDLCRPVNRLVDLGQIEGGLAQGLGWMTMEDLQYDEKGRLLSNALASYKVPEVYFMPDDLQIALLEDRENQWGPYGSKAVGEPPLMYGIGIFFAIRSAMRAFKPQQEFGFHAPMTPERVLLELYSGNVRNLLPKEKHKIKESKKTEIIS